MNVHPNRALALLAGIVLFPASSALAQVSFGLDGYQQDFNQPDSWPNITTAGFKEWTDNTTLAGWYATTVNGSQGYYRATNGNGANPTSGTGNPGAVSILAARSNADGALGSVSTATHHGVFGTRFVNQTGQTITSLTVTYTGEQWAWNNGGLNTLAFAYSLDATSLSTGNWTDYSALSFTALYSGGNNRGLDGNGNTIFDGTSSYIAKTESQAGGPDTLNYTTISATITGLSIAAGEEFWFRWTDTWAGSGSQTSQALAIDNLNITATVIPEPSTAVALAGLVGLAACLGLRSRRRDSR